MSSLIAPIASGVGGLLSSRSRSRAAKEAAAGARFSPSSISTPFGVAAVGNELTTGQLSPEQRMIQQALFGRASGGLFGTDEVADASQAFGGTGLSLLQQGGGELLNSPQFIQQALAQLQQQSGGIQGLFSGIGQEGLARAFGAPSGAGAAGEALNQAGGLFSQAQGFLNTPDPGNFQDVAGNTLGLLRQQAQPFEDRAFNALRQRQFNQGTTGSTGGALQTEAFARGLGQADTSRVLQSQQFAQGLQNQGFQQAQSRRGLGAGLLQQGSGLLGLGLQGIGQEQLQGRALGGIGQGLLSQIPNIQQGLFGAGATTEQLVGQRGLDRLRAAQGLFGFGQDVQNQEFQRGLQAFQGLQSQATQMQNLIALTANIESARAGAGANAGEFLIKGAGSPLGGFLSGLGGSGVDFGKIFSKGGGR